MLHGYMDWRLCCAPCDLLQIHAAVARSCCRAAGNRLISGNNSMVFIVYWIYQDSTFTHPQRDMRCGDEVSITCLPGIVRNNLKRHEPRINCYSSKLAHLVTIAISSQFHAKSKQRGPFRFPGHRFMSITRSSVDAAMARRILWSAQGARGAAGEAFGGHKGTRFLDHRLLGVPARVFIGGGSISW